MTWLQKRVAALSREDLKRVQRLAELLAGADRGPADTARAMLGAGPELATAEDARERVDCVVRFLELPR
jgi:hypothetical protein